MGADGFGAGRDVGFLSRTPTKELLCAPAPTPEVCIEKGEGHYFAFW